MKNRIWWFAALLPIVGIALAYLWTSQPVVKPNVEIHSHKGHDHDHDHSDHDHAKTGQTKPDVAELRQRVEESQRRLEEASARTDEAMRKVAASMTPERRARQVDAMMRSRQPAYQSLFDSWRIDTATGESAVKLIREREVRLSDQRFELFKDASKNVDAYKVNKEIEDTISRLELTKLLGKARFEELVAREKQMKQEAATRILGING